MKHARWNWKKEGKRKREARIQTRVPKNNQSLELKIEEKKETMISSSPPSPSPSPLFSSINSTCCRTTTIPCDFFFFTCGLSFSSSSISDTTIQIRKTTHSSSSSRGGRLSVVRCCSTAMDATASPTLFPLHRCKTLHLVRHAQGIHNVEGEKDHSAYMSEDLFDAHLTPLGWEQVDNLHKHVRKIGLTKKIDVVITSPLLRTMQTAVGVFSGESNIDGTDTSPPLIVANAGNSNRSAIPSSDSPPFIAVELCREHLGVRPCDKRRNITEYHPLFPAIDFSLIENEEDVLWKPDIRETNEEVAARGKQFINWLWTRKEKEIAIVTHSGFLFHTLSAFGEELHPLMKKEICTHFANCELRSVVIVDKSMAGSDTSTTNYPGKIPSGLDLPSDAAPDKLPEVEVPSSA